MSRKATRRDGVKTSAMTPNPATVHPKYDLFARLVARGMDQAQAYREAASKPDASPKTSYEQGARWARKMSARITELRVDGAAAVKSAAKAEYVYEYEDAMREADEIMALARSKEDPSGMSRALALKVKVAGLEVSARGNERAPLRDMDDSQLEAFIRENAAKAGMTLQ